MHRAGAPARPPKTCLHISESFITYNKGVFSPKIDSDFYRESGFYGLILFNTIGDTQGKPSRHTSAESIKCARNPTGSPPFFSRVNLVLKSNAHRKTWMRINRRSRTIRLHYLISNLRPNANYSRVTLTRALIGMRRDPSVN